MDNVYLHDNKEGLRFLQNLLKGFAKKWLLNTLKFEKVTGGWRLTVFMEDK
jgi:hypothetical protein